MNTVGTTNTIKTKNTWLDTLAQRGVKALLSRLTVGHLVVDDHGDIKEYGQKAADTEYHAHIEVKDSRAYREVFFNASLGGAEGYMKGYWTTPDLLAVIRFMVANLSTLNKLDSERPFWSRLAAKLAHKLNANTKEGSKKNISAHYDLGNDFFSQFLDSTMMYSAAIFPDKNADLHDASVHKLDRICQKLELKPDDHLLEIGTGWGGMAIHAAQHYGCKVTTTTISKEQYDYAREKVEALGLSDRVTLLLEDYRDLTGQYDKLVSIEMIEAVGHEYYDSYFEKCSSLIKDAGLMVIQAITIADQRYDFARNSVDFIQRYIFPGGCLPSNKVIADKVAQKTNMQIVAIEDITEHYANTLAKWREAFHAKRNQIVQMGFDDVFIRMWDYYLVYCEGGFRERSISTGQFVFAKPKYRFAQ
ncbi:methyltransferase domain-containing protein [Marinomonas mediterranea]|uniref:SAM-dependent methyltransferase n=1 Tax=Marinomonas mediterranea TaxID=119864 RepID=UPI00234AB9BB|nr:cyclopropane-fatty-acyl-phospholipid synthase family protein [Marinomonas mediterranea]WCN11959.1 methyltransferase domain-containing protein [Marinomonas mediterranea]